MMIISQVENKNIQTLSGFGNLCPLTQPVRVDQNNMP